MLHTKVNNLDSLSVTEKSNNNNKNSWRSVFHCLNSEWELSGPKTTPAVGPEDLQEVINRRVHSSGWPRGSATWCWLNCFQDWVVSLHLNCAAKETYQQSQNQSRNPGLIIMWSRHTPNCQQHRSFHSGIFENSTDVLNFSHISKLWGTNTLRTFVCQYLPYKVDMGFITFFPPFPNYWYSHIFHKGSMISNYSRHIS